MLKTTRGFASLTLGIFVAVSADIANEATSGSGSAAASANTTNNPAAVTAWQPVLPPAPEGVADFRLNQMFVSPIGPRGLEFTPEARALDGKKVRLTGFMVKQSQPIPWSFLLSPQPTTLHEREFGLAEDLPASAMLVELPKHLPPVLPHERGMLAVTGVLSLGNREEADGRISTARLTVEAPEPGARLAVSYVTNFTSVSATSPASPGPAASAAVAPITHRHPVTTASTP